MLNIIEYPLIEPFDFGFLKVSALHTIYYEQVGNPNGLPVVFLHGGPGGGINPDQRRFFDPNKYRVILFDQRGCGQSTPFAELKENTTWDLVADIEKLRIKFGISQWLVFGGSWGSTLALAYAVTHPQAVRGLILRGIFLCRPSEISWFYQSGAGRLFPEAWELFKNHIPPEDQNNLVAAYFKRLTDSNPEVQLLAAQKWSQWEAATSYLLPKVSAIEEMGDAQKALPFARIECHYFVNNAFFNSDQFLLEQCYKILHLPVTIVQGRYDVVCPAQSAWELKQALPQATLLIIPDAGHSASEPGIKAALIKTLNDWQ